MEKASTEQKRDITILWQIENISYWEHELHGNYIESPIFRPLNLGGTLLLMKIYPKGIDGRDAFLQVQVGSTKGTTCPINCEWSLLDGIGSTIFTKTFKHQGLSGYFDLPIGPTHTEVFVTRKSSFLFHDTLTIKFRIWKTNGILECYEHISSFTRINIAEESFVWCNEKFSSLQFDRTLTSRVQITHFPAFLMNISLIGSSLDEASVLFQIVACENVPVRLSLNLSILKGSEAIMSFEGVSTFNDKRNGKKSWDLPHFVSRKEVLAMLSSDNLTLCCRFAVVKNYVDKFIANSHGVYETYFSPVTTATRNGDTVSKRAEVNPRKDVTSFVKTSCSVPDQNSQISHTSQRKCNSAAVLLDDFLTLYKDQTLSDFELRSGDVSFPVHKNVLIARSPVFRAMFFSDMKEVNSTFLDIPDVDPHAINRMLTFLYTGTMEGSLHWEGVANLYYAADKYQVVTLKQECCSLLESSLTDSNVSYILELADRHQDKEMETIVHDFLLNHYDEIVMSDEWDNFLERNAILAGKTMKLIYKKKIQK